MPPATPSSSPLPIDPLLPEVVEMLGREGAAVLVAPPGAGKTTRVPLALLEAPWLEGRRILVLEPRRLAARSAARRMAGLLGEPDVGGTVGYRVRLDTRVGPKTRVEVVTEGILTRMLQSDPSLEGVGAVVFDEFHERSLHADLGLALTLQARSLFRSDLRILVMSATLDPGPVAELLDASVLESQGRQFPVETRWSKQPITGRIEGAVAATVRTAVEEEDGDVLVFLPGVGEIRRTAERLREGGLPDTVAVLELHGSLPAAEQDRAVTPLPGRRKVVLATSIAETSLTIEGVRVVVDAGLMRVPRFDPGTGMTRLETLRVTRDSADQRRGRAGRLEPGVCYRLWTRAEERGLVPRRSPEITEADLAPLALDLAVWGADPQELRWLDPPPDASYRQALELLLELGLLADGGQITPTGQEVVRLGLHPRLGRMLVALAEGVQKDRSSGGDTGLLRLACEVAALLSDRDILTGPQRAPDADMRLRVEALRTGRSPVGSHSVHRGGLHRARKEARHWFRRVAPAGRELPDVKGGGPGDVGEVGRLLALAYPDRVARKRRGDRDRYLLRHGGGARIPGDDPLAGSQWLVAAGLDARGREGRISLAAPLTEDEVRELFTSQFHTDDGVEWDEREGRVRAYRVTRLGAIDLTVGRLPDPDPHEVACALVQGIRAGGPHLLPWDREGSELRDRLQFLHVHDPATWPDSSETALLDTLEVWLAPFVPGLVSPDRISPETLHQALLARVAWQERSRLDALAPSHLDVPSGSRIRVDYSDPRAPALAVRLQEVFGLEETPRVGGGRVPVTMRLLSPAMRPVQVTRDLASFWDHGYFEVRKDLRGRYPKHYWPDDPRAATATRRTRPS
ncbi:MAG: ATP-dependent helicase HrpB [Gemmatimonadales bacterium]|nr:MAG: ATP-dependent helicase HrpB [Gemmatimonadales bacterium]